MQVDGVVAIPAVAEGLAGEELLNGEIGCQMNELFEGHAGQPFGVVTNDGALTIQDTESLLSVGAGIFFHLFLNEARAQNIFVGRIPDQRGVGANHKGHFVAQFLELAELAHGDGVAQMEVGFARIIAAINAQWAAFFLSFNQTLTQLLLHRAAQGFVTIFGALH